MRSPLTLRNWSSNTSSLASPISKYVPRPCSRKCSTHAKPANCEEPRRSSNIGAGQDFNCALRNVKVPDRLRAQRLSASRNTTANIWTARSTSRIQNAAPSAPVMGALVVKLDERAGYKPMHSVAQHRLPRRDPFYRPVQPHLAVVPALCLGAGTRDSAV